MAERKGERDEIVLDAIFDNPENVDEFVYDATEPDNTAEAGEGGTVEMDFTLPTPEVLRIISQNVRKNKKGDQVVDVIFEVSDIEGIDKYEFRVTKI